MTSKEFKKLDNSISSFEFLKQESEEYWKQIEVEVCWEFQIQKGSKWRQGLPESQIADFEMQLGLQFPESLKNYYRTMNGLDRRGLNNNGGEAEIEFGPAFYSYPDDIEEMKSKIDWITGDNQVLKADIAELRVPPIVPYIGHRFLVLDEEEIVLSMFGCDIIFWADNLSKGIAGDIFHKKLKVNSEKVNQNSFWNRKALHLEGISSGDSRDKKFL